MGKKLATCISVSTSLQSAASVISPRNTKLHFQCHRVPCTPITSHPSVLKVMFSSCFQALWCYLLPIIQVELNLCLISLKNAVAELVRLFNMFFEGQFMFCVPVSLASGDNLTKYCAFAVTTPKCRCPAWNKLPLPA